MDSNVSKRYMRLMEKSYANQETEVLIPAKRLNQIATIPLGFQPLGITSKDDNVLIADYFGPSICKIAVVEDAKGLHLKVSWIRGVNYQGKSVRLFPDIYQPGGANRLQTANFYKNGILITRNGDRKAYLIMPETEPEKKGRWSFKGEFPNLITVSDEGLIHSFLVAKNKLYTIESDGNAENWLLWKHWNDGHGHPTSVPPYTYGIGERSDRLSSELYTVTDFRSKEKHGIYNFNGNELAVPGICGNGICFLKDGSALITRYGQGHPNAFNGIPGALIYVPSRFFDKE